MAKGKNENAQTIGHGNARDNFANGFLENGPPNENAIKGLANAAANNSFIDLTTISFENGEIEITEEYDYPNYREYYGTYVEDGFTFDFNTYEDNPEGPANLGLPFHDADGDGDIELGTNDADDSRFNDNEYMETYIDVTQDNGETFSLKSFDVEDTSDNEDFTYDYFEFKSEVFDEAENAVQSTTAYTEDGENWRINVRVFDYDTFTTTSSERVWTTSDEDVAAMFTDVDTLFISTGGEFTVDDLVFI
jgi:hypothetical protein